MSEYAIIETGSKQYLVKVGDVIDVELLDVEGKSAIEFDQVLFFNDGKSPKMGAPTLDNALVKGEVVGESRGPKVVAYKYKQRKNSRRKVGHRQHYTRVKITEFAV